MRPAKVTDAQLYEDLAAVFRRKGYAGTSYSDIREATGLVKASLYHRFPRSKEASRGRRCRHRRRFGCVSCAAEPRTVPAYDGRVGGAANGEVGREGADKYLRSSDSGVHASQRRGTYCGLTPSMRRPVDVKAHFDFLLSVSLLPFSQAASVAILPSALFCERFSLGAHWVFSFQ